MEKQVLKLKLEKGVNCPEYKSSGASGFDIEANESVTIPAGKRKIIKTGIRANIPAGYEVQIRSRSDKAMRDGIIVLGDPITIDECNDEEWSVVIFNSSNYEIRIKKGMKIAYAVLQYVPKADIMEI